MTSSLLPPTQTELFVASPADRRQREPNNRRAEDGEQPHQQQQQQWPHLFILFILTGNRRAGKPQLASEIHKSTLFVLLFAMPRKRLYFHSISRRLAATLAQNASIWKAIIFIATLKLYLQLETRFRESSGGAAEDLAFRP